MLFLQGVLVSSYLLEIWKERSISGSRGARLDVGPVRHDGVETPKRVGFNVVVILKAIGVPTRLIPVVSVGILLWGRRALSHKHIIQRR